MSVMNLWRQLKKRLRVRRRWLSLGVWIIIIAGAATIANGPYDKDAESGIAAPASATLTPLPTEQDAKDQADALEAIHKRGGAWEVVMLKIYVCGEERQKLGALTPEGIVKLHREHPEWQLRLGEDGVVLMLQHIDDLSPTCKETAYFGIDDKGNLTLYDGSPDHNNSIRTFFQLDIGHLESSLPHETVRQLNEGIRITDIAEYNSVLSTFSDYAVEESKKAINLIPDIR